ncbi:MAG: hypothetical protein WC662_02240 [Candidatus Paceibacterota bacterium]
MESLANSNSTFTALKDTNYQPVSQVRVQYLLEHQSTCVADVISNSSMTAAAKLSLADFINSLVVFFPTELNGDVISDFVIKYEDTVLTNPAFTTNDKRIMLVTTSIARHSAYMARKKPKKNTDPDWTILVVNIVAAADGAENEMAKSVSQSLVGGIASNQN